MKSVFTTGSPETSLLYDNCCSKGNDGRANTDNNCADNAGKGLQGFSK